MLISDMGLGSRVNRIGSASDENNGILYVNTDLATLVGANIISNIDGLA